MSERMNSLLPPDGSPFGSALVEARYPSTPEGDTTLWLGKYILEPEDADRILGAIYLTRQNVARVGLGLCVMALLDILNTMGDGPTTPPAIFVVVPFAFAGTLLYVRWKVARATRELAAGRRHIALRVGDQFFSTCDAEGNETHLRWSSFAETRRGPRHLLLKIHGASWIAIPHRSFGSDKEVQAVGALVRSRVSATTRKIPRRGGRTPSRRANRRQ